MRCANCWSGYKRNPDQLAKIPPGMTVAGRLAQLKTAHGCYMRFPSWTALQGIDAMNLTFDPGFRGDRVFALVVGLGACCARPTVKARTVHHDRQQAKRC